MDDAHAWVRRVSAGRRAVFVAYPLSFDWTFLYWYFVRFCADGSPFGFSSCFDIKTAYAVKARATLRRSTKSDMPSSLRARRPHTHNALDDAIEQAELFANIFEWQGSPSP